MYVLFSLLTEQFWTMSNPPDYKQSLVYPSAPADQGLLAAICEYFVSIVRLRVSI